MTSIRIPLKTKIKSIQNSIPKEKKTEIIQDNKLIVKFDKLKQQNIEQKNIELQQQIDLHEHILQQAREESFISGIEEGKEQLQKEMKIILDRQLEILTENVKKITLEFEKELKTLDKPILKLSKEIAKKIISKELQFEENYNEILLSQITRILHELTDQENITIHIAPEQIEYILESNIEKEINIPGKMKIRFYEDKNLKSGECILESANLLVEGNFQSQLDYIESQLVSI